VPRVVVSWVWVVLISPPPVFIDARSRCCTSISNNSGPLIVLNQTSCFRGRRAKPDRF
jgi:hypothetical protein